MSIKGRIVGIDAVRGIAILGMFAAHVRPRTPAGESEWGWTWVFDGRSAATFAVLVGVSMTLLARGHSPSHSHARIATRAVLLIVLGLSLQQLQTPIMCILVNTGLMMLAGMWALKATTRVLVGLAAVFAILGPFVRVRLEQLLSGEEWACPEGAACYIDEGGGVWGFEWIGPRPYPTLISALWGFYPLVVWMAYVFVGILVGRMALRSWRALAGLGASGVALAVAGYGGSILVGGEERGFLDSSPGWWKSASPHTYTPFEVTGNLGVTLTLIALCCGIGIAARWLLIPLAAVGAMALTAYAGHIIAVWWLRNEPIFSAHVATLVWFWTVAIVVCTAWKYAFGRGPLELLLHSLSMRVAGPDGERTAPSTTTT